MTFSSPSQCLNGSLSKYLRSLKFFFREVYHVSRLGSTRNSSVIFYNVVSKYKTLTIWSSIIFSQTCSLLRWPRIRLQLELYLNKRCFRVARISWYFTWESIIPKAKGNICVSVLQYHQKYFFQLSISLVRGKRHDEINLSDENYMAIAEFSDFHFTNAARRSDDHKNICHFRPRLVVGFFLSSHSEATHVMSLLFNCEVSLSHWSNSCHVVLFHIVKCHQFDISVTKEGI